MILDWVNEEDAGTQRHGDAERLMCLQACIRTFDGLGGLKPSVNLRFSGSSSGGSSIPL